MNINFLHSRTQERWIHISYVCFLIVGILIGLLISFVLNVFIEDQKNELVSIIDTPSISDYPIVDQNPVDPVIEQKQTDVCQTNTTTQEICLAKNIEGLLKIHAVQSLTKKEFFPTTLRVAVEDEFQMEESLPENAYHHSATVYGVTVSSLEELLSISRMEGIKDIREFGTVQLN